MKFEGTPSDQLPDVLATGRGDADYVFISLSKRHPEGRDAEYLEWHTMDHRPEQYRLDGIRNSLRLVSTPACRAARAASEGAFDAVDFVQTYQFASSASIPAFSDLGAALDRHGRMAIRLPSAGYLTGELAGKSAAARVVAGADVIPWRPCLGVYLVFEEGDAPAEDLIDIPGVAGIWRYRGVEGEAGFGNDSVGKQMTYCYLDEDPVAVAGALGERVKQRWASGTIKGLLAAPFQAAVPFEWDKYLP